MDTLDDAVVRARESREQLVDYLDYQLNDPIWKLLGNALVDYRIQGFLEGMRAVQDFVELEAYERGYTDRARDERTKS
jgi:hypothetical protein